MDKCKEMDGETQEFYCDLILLDNFWNKPQATAAFIRSTCVSWRRRGSPENRVRNVFLKEKISKLKRLSAKNAPVAGTEKATGLL